MKRKCTEVGGEPDQKKARRNPEAVLGEAAGPTENVPAPDAAALSEPAGPTENVTAPDAAAELSEPAGPTENMAAPAPSAPPARKGPKRKVALLLGFRGTGYHGMQTQKDVKTIEDDLHAALVKAGAISACNADEFQKVKWARAARTDKGVHAAGQVVSLKMVVFDGVVEEINSHLPKQIRIYGFNRVMKSFSSKNDCGSRVYEYHIPSFALDRSNFKKLGSLLDSAPTEEDMKKPTGCRWVSSAHSKYPPELLNATASQESCDELTKILSEFNGTHTFHNFTTGKSKSDATAKRYILSFQVENEVRVKATSGQEINVVRCVVHGQSFMLHQIRKMIGFAICMFRRGEDNVAPLFDQAYEDSFCCTPRAPSNGLLLYQTRYESYNEKAARFGTNFVDWDSVKDVETKFRMEEIYPYMMEGEVKDKWFLDFLLNVDEQNVGEQFGDVNEYGDSRRGLKRLQRESEGTEGKTVLLTSTE